MIFATAWVLLGIGALAGWFLNGWYSGDQFPIGNALTAGTTLYVGWVIQRQFRRQAEVDKVPIETVGRVTKRIEELVWKCLDLSPDTARDNPELLKSLHLLANEIDWLDSIAKVLNADCEAQRGIRDHYFRFKSALTSDPRVNIPLANVSSRQLRSLLLQAQAHICSRVAADGSSLSADPSKL